MNAIRPARLVCALAMLLLVAGCWPSLPNPGAGALDTKESPVAVITSATAARDEVADEPSVTISYSVTYPSDLYVAQFPGGAASMTCQLTRRGLSLSTRTSPLSGVIQVVSPAKGPYTGSATLQVRPSDKFISGTWSLTCTLRSDRDLVTTAPVNVDIPCVTPTPPLGNEFSLSTPQSCEAPTTATATATPTTTTTPAEQYYIFVLPQVSGGSVVVSQESTLKTTPTCNFSGGGLCQGNDPPVVYQKVSQGFATLDEATAQWCSDLSGAKITNSPLAGDSHATVYGGDYWIGTAPGC